MYATVVALEDQDVILEVAPGIEVRYLRRAIMDVVPDPEPETGEAEPGQSETLDEAEDDAATSG